MTPRLTWFTVAIVAQIAAFMAAPDKEMPGFWERYAYSWFCAILATALFAGGNWAIWRIYAAIERYRARRRAIDQLLQGQR